MLNIADAHLTVHLGNLGGMASLYALIKVAMPAADSQKSDTVVQVVQLRPSFEDFTQRPNICSELPKHIGWLRQFPDPGGQPASWA